MLSYINNNWSIARRLTVIAVLGLLPCTLLLFSMVSSDLESIAVAKQEVAGVAAQKKVWAYLNATDAGGKADESDLKSVINAYPKEVKIAAEIDRMASASDVVTRTKNARNAMEDIANASWLLLDPETDSYFMMDIVSLRLVNIREQLVKIDALLQQDVAGKSIGIQLETGLALVSHKLDALLNAARRLKSANQSAWSRISSELQPFADFGNWYQKVEAGSIQLDRDSVKTVVRPIGGAIDRIWQDGSVELVRLLDDRIARKWTHVLVQSAIVLGLALAALASAVVLARAFAHSMNSQIAVLDRLSHNDDVVKIDFGNSRNEGRAIADALVRLRGSLSERRRLAAESERQAAEREALNTHYATEHDKFMDAFRKAAAKLASGDFDCAITEVVIDEYREIVEVMNATSKQLAEVQAAIKSADSQRDQAIAAVGAALTKLAEGDLSARIDVGMAREFEMLESDFNSALQQLELAIGEVKSNANSIKQGIEEISVASDDLSRRTENQAATLEQTSAAVAEITMAVAKTSDSASQANIVVTGTKADAVHSGEIVSNAIIAMSAIEKSSQQINQIIGVIDEIAFQTNLLALNAGVEAARAGEAGRGFAVVASEVRALAQRSADAAKQIKGLISTSAKEVTTGVELVGETGRALKRIVEQVGAVSVAVAEIAASAKQQSIGLSQVNTAVSQMDQVTQQNAAMVEEATAATRGLKQQTEHLSIQIERFKTSNLGMSDALVGMQNKMAAVSKPRASLAKGSTAKGKPAVAVKGSNRLSVSNGGWEEF